MRKDQEEYDGKFELNLGFRWNDYVKQGSRTVVTLSFTVYRLDSHILTTLNTLSKNELLCQLLGGLR